MSGTRGGVYPFGHFCLLWNSVAIINPYAPQGRVPYLCNLLSNSHNKSKHIQFDSLALNPYSYIAIEG